MKHATYDFISRSKVTHTHTQSLNLGPKASSNFMVLFAVLLIL